MVLDVSVTGNVAACMNRAESSTVKPWRRSFCINQAESYFSRLRRAEIGTHRHISGRYLQSYANEMARREDNRREPNGMLYLLAASGALGHTMLRE